MKDKTYTIGELAKMFDITHRAIRFYEQEGMLTPEREGMKRIYHYKDVVKLKLIVRGKRLGFSLSESRELIEMYSPEQNEAQYRKVLEKIELSRARLQQQLDDIQQMLGDLDEHENDIREALGSGNALQARSA